MSRKRKQRDFRWLMLLFLAAFCGCLIWGVYQRDKVELLLVDDTLYAAEIRNAAARYSLPPELVRALILRESRFDRDAVGEDGEIGLMQIHPKGAVAEWARINKCSVPSERELFTVEKNLDIGCWYLARALKRWEKYRCSTELALAEYNAGAKNASRWVPSDPDGDAVKNIDFPGTKTYVEYITARYKYYLSE